jgi:hypothetical protein
MPHREGFAMVDSHQTKAAGSTPAPSGRWIGELERLVKQRTAWADAIITPFARSRRSRSARRRLLRSGNRPGTAA